MSYHPLDSRFRLMLGSMDALLKLEFSSPGISGRTTWISLGETLALNGFIWSGAISAPGSLLLDAEVLVSRFVNYDSARINSLFSAKSWLGFQWMMWCQFICSVILWIHGWGCYWGWWNFCSSLTFRDTLLRSVGLAGLGTDSMVMFFFCDFFWG